MFVRFVLLFTALLALSHLSFADESVTDIFVDPDCVESARNPIKTSLPFSNECQQLDSEPGAPLRSAIIDCFADSRGLVMFTYMVYNNTDMCADFNGGNLEIGLESYGPYQGCMKTKLLENNRFTPVYSRISCQSEELQAEFQTLKLQSVALNQGPIVMKSNPILQRNKAMKKKKSNRHNHI